MKLILDLNNPKDIKMLKHPFAIGGIVKPDKSDKSKFKVGDKVSFINTDYILGTIVYIDGDRISVKETDNYCLIHNINQLQHHDFIIPVATFSHGLDFLGGMKKTEIKQGDIVNINYDNKSICRVIIIFENVKNKTMALIETIKHDLRLIKIDDLTIVEQDE